MKSFRKFIGAFVCAVILITTVFSIAAFGMDEIYQVTYTVSDNVKELVTKKEATETWDAGGAIYPTGYTAEEVTGYEFYRWVEQGKESLPAGWTYEGLTLSFNKDAEGVTPGGITFVAEYKLKELKSGSVLQQDSKETGKLVLTNDKKDSPSVIKEDKIDKTSVTVEDETIEAVKTGDTNNSFVWILIGALALVAIIAAVIVLLRNKK